MAKCDTGYGLQVASYKWQVAVVTGAASGLGFEFTKLLAADSFDLILIDIDGKKLKEVKQSIEETYRVDVEIVVSDLSKPHIISDIYSKIRHRDIDVLINSAGFGLVGFFPETEWQIEEAMIHLHIISTTHLTKLVVRDMLTRGKGRIMNVASLAALIPGPLMSVYYATKAYLLSFSTALANEMKGKPVTKQPGNLSIAGIGYSEVSGGRRMPTGLRLNSGRPFIRYCLTLPITKQYLKQLR